MDQELNQKIDAFIEANKEQMLQDIAELVAINSVEAQPAEGAPFGQGPRAALDKALETRSAKYRRIEGKATVRTGTDDKGRGRVTGIDLDVTVFMDQEYEFIFDRVEKIMKQGCLITGSLEAAFPVKYNLNLECDED